MFGPNRGVYLYLNMQTPDELPWSTTPIEGCGGPADGFRQEMLSLQAKQGVRKFIREGLAGILVTTKGAVTPAACERRPLHAADVRHRCLYLTSWPPCGQ